MDKLVVVAGGITAALGIGFLVAHLINPFLSSAFVSGGVGGIVIGIGMIVWGKRLSENKVKEEMT